jgi:hypothetical protein
VLVALRWVPHRPHLLAGLLLLQLLLWVLQMLLAGGVLQLLLQTMQLLRLGCWGSEKYNAHHASLGRCRRTGTPAQAAASCHCIPPRWSVLPQQIPRGWYQPRGHLTCRSSAAMDDAPYGLRFLFRHPWQQRP